MLMLVMMEMIISTWYKSRNGVKIEGSDFFKETHIVIYECERDECSDQIAYRELSIVSGKDADTIENRERIHIDLAKEEMFVDKI
jgi:hypothetical protein